MVAEPPVEKILSDLIDSYKGEPVEREAGLRAGKEAAEAWCHHKVRSSPGSPPRQRGRGTRRLQAGYQGCMVGQCRRPR